ncbi:F-box protein [Canna indica]|uniref:F-box protein n=1 Tax=Canna indica TaxID=4628 RepID=A0AAQ3KRQ4_9LILI|nr:F-box protein [Canna indica]
MVSSLQLALDEVKQLNLPATPKTPKSTHYDSQARLESLTMDLIVKILCHLHHDQLKAVFHVSQRIRAAVIQARQSHFNYTTPDKSRQQMLRTRTPIPAEHWPFLSIVGRRRWGSCPHTPIAQRLAPRASQFKLMEMKQIAVVLFQDSTLPPKHMVRHSLSRPVLKPLGSTRVLLYEDELCQAVSQNKLL